MAASSSFSARAQSAGLGSATTTGMISGVSGLGRSHVSSEEDTEATRHQDRATNFGAQVAVGSFNVFAAAIFIQRATCTVVWNFLQVCERQQLISICRMADSWCLTHIRAFSAPVIPPLQPSLGCAGERRVSLGRFARGVRMQRCKDAFFRRLGALEPVFSGLDDMDASAAATPEVATTTADRTLHDVVADLAHQVAVQELRLQALERQVRRS